MSTSTTSGKGLCFGECGVVSQFPSKQYRPVSGHGAAASQNVPLFHHTDFRAFPKYGTCNFDRIPFFSARKLSVLHIERGDWAVCNLSDTQRRSLPRLQVSSGRGHEPEAAAACALVRPIHPLPSPPIARFPARIPGPQPSCTLEVPHAVLLLQSQLQPSYEP